MSSFIVSQDCMKSIIYNLFWNHKFKNRSVVLSNAGYHTSEDFDRLAKELWAYNRSQVNYRYDDKDKTDYSKGFNWDNGELNMFQCLKSLHCLQYQCSESDALEKTRIALLLKDIVHSWESFILTGFKEYDEAKWD